jgi:hypothetical protein
MGNNWTKKRVYVYVAPVFRGPVAAQATQRGAQQRKRARETGPFGLFAMLVSLLGVAAHVGAIDDPGILAVQNQGMGLHEAGHFGDRPAVAPFFHLGRHDGVKLAA